MTSCSRNPPAQQDWLSTRVDGRVLPRNLINSGRTAGITPHRSNARIPRSARARLMERPESTGPMRGSARRSNTDTAKPRRASASASSDPARPAPTMFTGCGCVTLIGWRTRRFGESFRKAEDVLKAVIERDQRDPQHIRCAPVTEQLHAPAARQTPARPRSQASSPDARSTTAVRLGADGAPRRHDLDILTVPVHRVLEKPGQCHSFARTSRIPASRKMASDATSGAARDNIGGLLT